MGISTKHNVCNKSEYVLVTAGATSKLVHPSLELVGSLLKIKAISVGIFKFDAVLFATAS